MEHEDFTRAERRTLRELAGVAGDRELGAELARLEASFRAWRAGQISPSALSDRIHAFHHGPARDLYVLYTRVPPETLVARAVASAILREDEIPPDLVARLARQIAAYRAERTPLAPLGDADPPTGGT